MKTELENNILTIFLDGRIDSVNDRQTEAELNAALDAAPAAALVLDAAALTYISSAGLRVLLRLHRKTPRKIRILNVRPEVYDIFEVTGFTELFDVRKKLREVSVDGCAVIGRSFFMKYFGVSDESSLQPYFGMLMPLFALNSVLTSGDPADPGHFVPEEIVKKMLREAITPNEEMIRQALQTLS